ncbi:MAG: hypothetical protein Q9M91_01060 [Candidatus Dojkabacteria bacterium]|nr:hypothetical protein [Candidatus Dojkabacteria bacterium]MDQ7020416.1 hypothetical protein [Candidatus Dojkabacteria bacterium]
MIEEKNQKDLKDIFLSIEYQEKNELEISENILIKTLKRSPDSIEAKIRLGLIESSLDKKDTAKFLFNSISVEEWNLELFLFEKLLANKSSKKKVLKIIKEAEKNKITYLSRLYYMAATIMLDHNDSKAYVFARKALINTQNQEFFEEYDKLYIKSIKRQEVDWRFFFIILGFTIFFLIIKLLL